MAVADLGVRIFLEDSASAGFGAFGSSLGHVGRLIGDLMAAWQSLDPFMKGVALTAAGSGIAFAGFAEAIKFAVDSAAELEKALTTVQVAFNATHDQILAFQPLLLDLANNSMYSAINIANGFEMLGEHGMKLADIMNKEVGQSMINLAEAIHTQPVPAAKLLSTTLQIFALDSSHAAEVSDLLTAAFYNGIPSASSLGSAIGQAGPAAASLGISLQDLLPYLDFLAQRMGSGAQAGTSLKNALQSIQNPIPSATKELGELGLITINSTNPALQALQATVDRMVKNPPQFDGTVTSFQALFSAAQKVQGIHTDQTFLEWGTRLGILNNTLYDAQGKFNGLNNFMLQLEGSFEKLKLTPEEVNQALGKMFNRTALKAMEDLVNNTDATNRQLDLLRKALGEHGVAAKDAADITGTFDGRVKELQTTFKDFAGVVGGPIRDILRDIMAFTNPLLSAFTHMPGPVAMAAGAFLLIGGVLSGLIFIVASLVFLLATPLAGILGTVAGIVGGLTLGALALGIAASFIASHWETAKNVLVLVGAALLGAAVGAGLLYVAMHVQLVAAFIGATVQGVIMAVTYAAQVIPLLSALTLSILWTALVMRVQMIGSFLASIPAALAAGAAWMIANWPLVLLTAGIILLGVVLLGAVIGFVVMLQQMGAWNTVVKVAQAVWKTLQDVWKDFVAAVMPALKEAFNSLKPAFAQIMDAFNQAKPIFLILGAIIGGIVVIAIGLLLGVIKGLAMALAGLVKGLAMIIGGIVQVVTGIIQVFMGFFTLLHGLFTGNTKEIQAGWNTMVQGILNIVNGLVKAVVGVFVGLFSAIVGFVTGFVSGIISWFTHLADALVHHSIIPDMVNAILSWIGSLPGKALGFISGLVGSMVGMFVSLGSQVGGAVGFLVNNFVSLISSLPGRAMSALAGLGGMMLEAGSNVMKMLASGITGAIHLVTGAVTGAANAVKNFLGFKSPTKEGPLSDSDSYMPNMMKMHAKGIHDHIPLLKSAASSAASALGAGFVSPSLSGGSVIGQNAFRPVTISVYLDSKQISTAALKNLTQDLKINGVGRTLR